MEKRNFYNNPLTERYASKEMSYIFSDNFKFFWWRKLWLYLAMAQKNQGLLITEEQIKEMEENLKNIDFEYAQKKEKEFRHDVMAHVHTFGKVCPKAMPIIHLGATSAYVGDNTDLIQIKEALKLVEIKLKHTLKVLSDFAIKTKDLPILGFTHFQPAQPTTLGKRVCLWIQEFLLDIEELHTQIDKMPFRGIKGTTGTQASFLTLFDGDHNKVKKVNDFIRQKVGFKRDLKITGQTYSRKIDSQVLKMLSSIAESASKFSMDLRLLAHKKEVEEPFENKQIGSSAMAYKRNPMRAERIGSLSRFVMSLVNSTSYTASSQWFERTLDDSANKRLSIPQAFLAVDSILDILRNIVKNIVVYEKVIHKNLIEELPFMLTENIIMECVKKGGDRQELHEEIRQLSLEAGKVIKLEGKPNNLIELMSKSKMINMSISELQSLMNPKNYIGRSVELTEEFLEEEVSPWIENLPDVKDESLRV